MKTSIRVYLFKEGSHEFLNMVEGALIKYERKSLFSPGTVVASGEVIEIIKAIGGASIIPSLAAVIVQWLKNKSSRKIIIQTMSKEIIHLEGYNIEEVEKALEIAESFSVIQTSRDELEDE